VAKPELQDKLYSSSVLEVIFALVQRRDNPGGDSFEMIPGLYAAADGEVVAHIIESEPARARFVAGLVAWREGELLDEIKKGAWYVLEPDAALLMRKTDGLWEELLRRAVRAESTI
jgi:putative AlgH/UPF0301 family transcriptional regulator